MPKQVLVLGGGGHGRVVLDALISSGVNVTGILDSKLKVGDQVFGVPVLGGDDFLEKAVPANVLLVNGVGADSSVHTRRNLFQSMKLRGFSFDSVQHRCTVIGPECDLGEGSQIMAGAILQNRVRIGDNAVINTHASIDHDCIIGAHAFVSPGTALCGGVNVAESAFIGAGSVVIPGIQIGESAVVGAGAVVTKSVPAGWIVAGNPAIKIGMAD